MTEPNDTDVVLDEMKNVLRYQFDSVDILKANSKSILETASLITGLIGILQIFRPLPEQAIISYFILLGVTTILYIILIAICIVTLSPMEINTPIEPKWEVIKEFFMDKDPKEIRLTLLSAYLNAINLNKPVIEKRRRLITLAGVLLGIIVLNLVILGVIPSFDSIVKLITGQP